MELNPIFSDNRDECLAHYGVPGMKWGVRHDRPRTGKRFSRGNVSAGTNSDRKNNKKFHLTDKQKKAVKTGAVIAGVALGSVVAYQAVNHLATKKLVKDKVYEAGKRAAQEAFRKEKSFRGKLDPGWALNMNEDVFVGTRLAEGRAGRNAAVKKYMKNIRQTRAHNRGVVVRNAKRSVNKYARQFPKEQKRTADFYADWGRQKVNYR